MIENLERYSSRCPQISPINPTKLTNSTKDVQLECSTLSTVQPVREREMGFSRTSSRETRNYKKLQSKTALYTYQKPDQTVMEERKTK